MKRSLSEFLNTTALSDVAEVQRKLQSRMEVIKQTSVRGQQGVTAFTEAARVRRVSLVQTEIDRLMGVRLQRH